MKWRKDARTESIREREKVTNKLQSEKELFYFRKDIWKTHNMAVVGLPCCAAVACLPGMGKSRGPLWVYYTVTSSFHDLSTR